MSNHATLAGPGRGSLAGLAGRSETELTFREPEPGAVTGLALARQDLLKTTALGLVPVPSADKALTQGRVLLALPVVAAALASVDATQGGQIAGLERLTVAVSGAGHALTLVTARKPG